MPWFRRPPSTRADPALPALVQDVERAVGIKGQKVLVVGEASGDLATLLKRAGARKATAHSPVRGPRGDLPQNPFPMSRLPYKDGTFDLVVAHHALSGTSDLEGGLRDLLRVTRPGGHLFAASFASDAPAHVVQRRLDAAPRSARERLLAHLSDGLDAEAVSDAMASLAGHGHVSLLDDGPHPELMEKWGAAMDHAVSYRMVAERG
ncbi:MAG: class I SAM-dependent methyltransferase, partial [Thermoplasmatota archaeon]